MKWHLDRRWQVQTRNGDVVQSFNLRRNARRFLRRLNAASPIDSWEVKRRD